MPAARLRSKSDQTESSPVNIVSAQNRGVSWTLRADLVETLLPWLQRVAENPALYGLEGTVETVKTGPHRTVYRLCLPSDEFYVKHFRNDHWKGLLLNLVRPTKAKAEWQAAQRIAQLAVPTFEPVALGIVRRDGLVADSFLVSRGIPNAIPLDEFVAVTLLPAPEIPIEGRDAGRQCELRQALATAVGELSARLHLAGVEHADFHAANILVRLEPDGHPRLWLIDLHRVYFRSSLSDEQRFRNLAFLHQFFTGKSTRTDRLRFHRAYQRIWGQRSGCGASPKGATPLVPRDRDRTEIALLEQHLSDGAQRGWRRADRAWRRGHRHVKKLDGASDCCRGVAALNLAWFKQLRDDPERLFRDDVVVWHKQTAKHRIAEVKLSDDLVAPHGTAFFKSVERPGLWQNWLARFRDSPVRKAWEYGHALLRRQIDTPRPILCIERGNSQPRRSYLLTEAVPGTTTATEFLARDWLGLSPETRGRWLRTHSRRLAFQVRRLHESGFDHRDLKFSNLLVSHDLDDPRIWFLDLDGMRAWRRIPEQRSIQNLARINVSAQVHALDSKSERVRFLKWYLGAERSHTWKSWWRRIAETSARKLATNKRRGRAVH
ncbi:MAG TPA: lipopolysaccharide kinase InaA family protein [Planctomycetaceae bacterium]